MAQNVEKEQSVQRSGYNLIRYYAGEVQHNRYALVRKWFVEQFPEFRKNPLYYFNNTPEVVPAKWMMKQSLNGGRRYAWDEVFV